MFCTKCGNQLPENSKFCKYCGNPVRRNQSLLERARNQEEDALAEIYNQSSSAVYRVIKVLVKDEDTVYDILQDTYVKAFTRLDQLQHESKLVPWLKMIANNTAKDWLKKCKPVLFTDMSGDNESDDLSFEEFEIEYKFLKAVIEGGVETKPENILIYATSNRRHLIKESWNDRNDQDNSNDRHHSDTVEEKLSLVNRFGVTINYSKPTQKEYFDIVLHLARRAGVTLPDEQLRAEANKWELSHGGISGRTAEQFVSYLASQPDAFK